MFSNFTFYAKTTPEFANAFQTFMPQWVASLVPYYQVAKKHDAELFGTSRVLDFNADKSNIVVDNGILYHISNVPGYFISMAVSADHKGATPGNWHYDFHYDEPNHLNNVWNFVAYNSYLSRISNSKAPYDEVANAVNAYFRQLTGDPDVFLSLSWSSYICLTKRAKQFVMDHYYLD